MATTNTLLTLLPENAYSEGGIGGAQVAVPVNNLKGVGFNPGVDSSALWRVRLPATAALATGATCVLLVCDDPLQPDSGKVARFGVTFYPLGTASTYIAAVTGHASPGTETAGNVTMPTDTARPATGKTKTLSIAAAVADMGGIAASDWV